MRKIRVGVLGATGAVGQRFVQLLADHPYFDLTVLAASERSAGKRYKEATNWILTAPMPARLADQPVEPMSTDL
ncbi:MAG: aspartate-semialdehyde dehydrogenase, partial [Planctomycetes bacterium]|nr:aspartate-semialdehyde dehydrogenase [Planctomycetota bacterium]